MDTKLIKDKLQPIVEICTDSVLGYEAAAEKIPHADLKTLMLRISQQRKAFIEEIKQEGLKLGIDIEAESTVKGYFHRTWLKVKSTLSNHTAETVIKEAIYGEETAAETYTDALESTAMPEYLRHMLTEQRRLIKIAIVQLEGLQQEVLEN